MTRVRMTTLAAVPAIAAWAAAGSAFAAPATVRADVLAAESSNWAGYALDAPAPFTNVSGAWIQPAATCTAGTPTFSAFWVGLGGSSPASQALEQVGTQADCSPNGRVTYGIWYELVPAAPVTVRLPLEAG